MKKRVIQFIIVGLLGLALFSVSVAVAENDLESGAAQLVTKLHNYFPNVKGTVVSVQAENIFIDLGMEHELVMGAQLAILQEGVEIVHPTSGQVLGSYEKLLGTVQVVEVRERFSVAQVLWLEAGTEILPGMMVGGIPGRVKLGMLPARPSENAVIDSLAVQRILVQTLRSDERFTVFDDADVQAAALKAEVVADQLSQKQFLAEINKILQAHNFLQINLQSDAGSDTLLMQVLLFSPEGEEVGSVQEMFALRAFPAEVSPVAVVETLPVSPPISETIRPSLSLTPDTSVVQHRAQEKFWKSDILRMKIHKLAVGDVTGDGKNEVVLTSQSEIEIYAHGVLGEKDSFHLIGKFGNFSNASILNVDVADINQNGRAEIFLTTLQTISSDVQVFEYDAGNFQKIWSSKGLFMRVLHRPTAEPLLIGQNTTSSLAFDFFSGKVAAYNWEGKNYVRQDALNIPGRMDIVGIALADVNNNGNEEVLWYDRNDRVHLFRNKTLVWRSRSYEPYKMNILRRGEDERTRRPMVGRIELTNIGSDVDMRLVLINNLRSFRILSGLPMYNGSHFIVFRWNGEKFAEEFTSQEFGGYITDYAVTDIDQDGQQEIVMAMVLKGDDFFRTPQSQIVVYELE